MAVAEISVVPLGTGSPSVSEYVAGAIRVLQQEKDVSFELTPMGTIIEGDVSTILRVTERMHQSVFREGVTRVVTTIRIDDRHDKPLTGRGKIDSVTTKL